MDKDNHFDFAKSVNEKVIETSNSILRSLVIVHGGAIVAIMGFISGVFGSKMFVNGASISDMTDPLLWFGYGILATIIAMIMSYFTNFMVVGHAFSEFGSKHERGYARWKIVFHLSAILAVLASLGLFLFGVSAFRNAIASATFVEVSVNKESAANCDTRRPGQ